ncbi:SAICAR synthase-like protein [Schizophyllum commune H4-8]|uniref:PIPK domain-containing protein n=1 Tax=Schizophyllum commune (strain H4-8 / FGSC 9210) TaxID=578458 RepID=D8QH41_SCHCM|nr:SAICAR synthase-like protein [Schizophyllum commune H4-8]KAI5887015.1 SAICAR synthase-like protein [Schizophyllum commune H4-8]
MKRPLTDEDFAAQHKYSFDIVGNELTPSVHYDFKFKDYAPWVFRELREEHFHLDPADYLLSLTAKYILSELGSPGKSGSFFYFSRDYRFIIKTIRHEEHKFLRSVLKDYVNHVRNNPHTLLSRFYGLHRVKMPHGRKIHFVIMNNLFPPHRDIHETYDLKGSTVGRYAPEDPPPAPGEQPKSSKVLKDINWIKKGRRLELGPEKRALLTEQLRRDKEFLKNIHGERGGSHGVMDYSLLVGIHSMERGNRDHVRRKTLKVFEPELRGRRNHQDPTEASAVRRAMRQSDPKQLHEHELTHRHPTHHRRTSTSSANGPASPVSQAAQPKVVTIDASAQPGRTSTSSAADGPSLIVPNQQPVPENASHGALGPTDDVLEGASLDQLFQDRQHFLFYQDEGGLRATDEYNLPMDTIYYLGVIDILTPYGCTKKVEHFWKGLKADRHKISPVPPSDYAERFFSFMKAIMRNGGDPETFLTGKDKEKNQ